MYKVKEETGVVLNEKNFTVVKKAGKKGDSIPEHNHPEADVLFTVVKGNVVATINGKEKINLIPGKILNFDGINHISAEFMEDSEVFVILVLK